MAKSVSGKKQIFLYAEGGMRVKRPIDISKDSNKKCEHCDHWTGWKDIHCELTGEKRLYYRRCKRFCWKKGLLYTDSSVKTPEANNP